MRITDWEIAINPRKRFSFPSAEKYIAEERAQRDKKIWNLINETIAEAMSENHYETVLVFYQSVPSETYDVKEALRLVVESLYDSGFKVSLKENAPFQNAQGKTETADFVLTIGWNWKEEEEDNG